MSDWRPKSSEDETLGVNFERLTVRELNDLIKQLEARWGVTVASDAVVDGGASAGSAPEEEQTEFDVILTDIGANKIQVIMAVRELTSLGLKEAKELVDAAPSYVKRAVSRSEAIATRARLQQVGARAYSDVDSSDDLRGNSAVPRWNSGRHELSGAVDDVERDDDINSHLESETAWIRIRDKHLQRAWVDRQRIYSETRRVEPNHLRSASQVWEIGPISTQGWRVHFAHRQDSPGVVMREALQNDSSMVLLELQEFTSQSTSGADFGAIRLDVSELLSWLEAARQVVPETPVLASHDESEDAGRWQRIPTLPPIVVLALDKGLDVSSAAAIQNKGALLVRTPGSDLPLNAERRLFSLNQLGPPRTIKNALLDESELPARQRRAGWYKYGEQSNSSLEAYLQPANGLSRFDYLRFVERLAGGIQDSADRSES